MGPPFPLRLDYCPFNHATRRPTQRRQASPRFVNPPPATSASQATGRQSGTSPLPRSDDHPGADTANRESMLRRGRKSLTLGLSWRAAAAVSRLWASLKCRRRPVPTACRVSVWRSSQTGGLSPAYRLIHCERVCHYFEFPNKVRPNWSVCCPARVVPTTASSRPIRPFVVTREAGINAC